MDNDTSLKIPRDLEAEKSVLGAVLLRNEALEDASEILVPEDFYLRAHQIIFQAMLSLEANNIQIDEITLKDQLNQTKQLEDVDKYLLEFAETVPSSARVMYYADIVKRKSLLRNLISTSEAIINDAMSDNDEVTDILDNAERKILDVAQNNNSSNFKSIRSVLNETMNEIEEADSNADSITGLATGYKALDSLTTGFHEDELIILAARPGVGKTAFALNICQFVGIESKKSVAIFSLEMGANQLVQRMLCSEGLIDSTHLRTGNLTNDEWNNLVIASGTLGQTSIFIDDSPGIKMSEIRAKTRRLAKEQGNLGLIVIDYLQLIEGSRRENRQQEVSEISRQLKKLAKELHVPVIALSQLSRGVEQRQDKRPVLSDIRESGSIEQDADIVAFLYRDDYYRDEDGDQNEATVNSDGVIEAQDTGIVEVIVEKNRSGKRGTAQLVFTKSHNRFSNLEASGPEPY